MSDWVIATARRSAGLDWLTFPKAGSKPALSIVEGLDNAPRAPDGPLEAKTSASTRQRSRNGDNLGNGRFDLTIGGDRYRA